MPTWLYPFHSTVYVIKSICMMRIIYFAYALYPNIYIVQIVLPTYIYILDSYWNDALQSECGSVWDFDVSHTLGNLGTFIIIMKIHSDSLIFIPNVGHNCIESHRYYIYKIMTDCWPKLSTHWPTLLKMTQSDPSKTTLTNYDQF